MDTQAPQDMTQLATRVPKGLIRALKIRCVESGESMQDFIANALAERLAQKAKKGKRGHGN